MERHSRTIAKTVTWRIIGTVITVVVIYFFERDVEDSLTIGISANLIKMGFYYVHERLWNRSAFGREMREEKDYSI